MENQEINGLAVGDLVTIPSATRRDVTRTGRVESIKPLESATLLVLESVTAPGVKWVEYLSLDMIVTPAYGKLPTAPECGHEITGGYVYTGIPTDSRSMTLRMTALHDIDGERTWIRAWDPQDMEVEVTITDLTLSAIDRLTDRPAPASDAVGALRACMAQYLDDARDGRQSDQWHAARDGAAGMLHHLVMVTLGLSDEAATEWLAEELQEMLAARD